MGEETNSFEVNEEFNEAREELGGILDFLTEEFGDCDEFAGERDKDEFDG